MCHWLTLAVVDGRALAPLSALGTLEQVAFPHLPEPHRRLQRFLLTDGGCSCALFGQETTGQLERALRAVACIQPVALAHRCFGDPPGGVRAAELRPLQPGEPAEFVRGEPTWAGGWVRLLGPFVPAAPLPLRIDGAQPLAVAALQGRQHDGAVAVVMGRIEHVPGVVVARCNAGWEVLQSDWHASADEGRAATPGLDWQAAR